MSNSPTTQLENSHNDHGSMKSYVIGYILSLLFTAIPYYLVVNKTLTGTALLSAILGIAVIQMVIQIFFFLHLGRGPKPLYNVVFFVFTVGIILVVVAGSIFIINNLHYNMSPSDVTKNLAQNESIAQVEGAKTGACQTVHTRYKITFTNGIASPQSITTKLCDSLTFINEDNTVREITFGPHPKHESYGGQSEIKVHKGYAKTINLNQSGTYLFHDHLEPTLNGSFIVNQ